MVIAGCVACADRFGLACAPLRLFLLGLLVLRLVRLTVLVRLGRGPAAENRVGKVMIFTF